MTAVGETAPQELEADALRLHSLMMAYLGSKALFSALELGVFDGLEKGPVTAEELGEQIGLSGRPARALLLALLGEKLVRKDGDTYRNEPIASTFLVSASPRYMGALAEHQGTHFEKMAKLTDCLKEDKPVRAGGAAENYSGAFGSGDQGWARRWAAITRASSLLMAEKMAGEVKLANRAHLVELGCGSAAYSIALAKANPGLRVTAVDQERIAEVATEFVTDAGMSDRITVRVANIFTDTFPGADAALLSHVIQGFSRERTSALIKHVYGWLPEGGRLFVHTHLYECAQTSFPYLFGLILQVNNTQGGEAHGQELTCGWMRDAGFKEVWVNPASPISALITAVK